MPEELTPHPVLGGLMPRSQNRDESTLSLTLTLNYLCCNYILDMSVSVVSRLPAQLDGYFKEVKFPSKSTEPGDFGAHKN